MRTILKSKIPDMTENEFNVAWFIFESLHNIIEREKYNAAISVRQLISLIKTKRLDAKTLKGKIKPSWTQPINVALRAQVTGFDEDMDKEIDRVINNLNENLDKKTGELDPSAKATGSTLKEMEEAAAEEAIRAATGSTL